MYIQCNRFTESKMYLFGYNKHRDTRIGDAQKHAKSIPMHDTKILRDSYSQYVYVDTAYIYRSQRPLEDVKLIQEKVINFNRF